MSAEEVAAILDGGEEEGVSDAGTLPRGSEPMSTTDEREGRQPEPGDFEDDQEPEDRTPRPGNAPAPGQRPSESGSNPPDIETEAK